MPIDLQCPDCEHTFQVPSSMAGKRTLCRGCNAALIVPELYVEDEPEEELPQPRSRRTAPPSRTVEEKPPNWDTPIPFQSPVPIVGVLLIALVASVLILGIYGIVHVSTVASKPAPFTGTYTYATQPTVPSRLDPKTEDTKPTVYDREVILPNREVILPKVEAESKLVANAHLPPNWVIVRESGRRGFGRNFNLHDRATGRIAGSIVEHRGGVADSGLTASPSGRWFAQITDADAAAPSVELYLVQEAGTTALKWTPYPRGSLKACVLLSDDRLLTVSGAGSFDLWAIPSGEYIRRVVVLTDQEKASTFDISTEKSLLAIQNGNKIEVHPLGDDEFGKLTEFAPEAETDVAPSFQFSSDGKKLVVLSALRGGDGTVTDRVESFDLDRKRKAGGWTLKSPRRRDEEIAWRAGSDALLVHFLERGTVSEYGLADGKQRSTLEAGPRRQGLQLERAGDRVWLIETGGNRRDDESALGRLYGFDLPLRTPLTIRKDPVWEYRSGVLELKKSGK